MTTEQLVEDQDLDLKNDNLYLSYILKVRNSIVKWMKHLYVVGILYFTWITVHFVSSNLYVYYCTPLTLTGYVQSPFMVLTPHCIALRWLSYKGSEQIASMWSIIGAYLLSVVKEYLTEK